MENTDEETNVITEEIIHHPAQAYHEWKKSVPEGIAHNYHIVSDGILTKKDFTILFENEDRKSYLPVELLDSLSIYSNVSFGSGFFELAEKEGFSVSIINKTGNLVGRFIPKKWTRDIHTEIAQIELCRNDEERLRLSREFQKANIFNIRASLRYYERRKKIEYIHTVIEDITEILSKLDQADKIETLMLYEAHARQKYYRCFNYIMSADGFEFTRRTRQPPRDPLNAMIGFGNTLLYTKVANEIYRSSLDIRFGILHHSEKRPENLNLDLADLFKPILVDRTIFTLVNRKMINAIQDFEEVDNGGIYMTYRGKKVFIREFERKLTQQLRIGNRLKAYTDLIRDEVMKVQNYFRKGIAYKPYKYVN